MPVDTDDLRDVSTSLFADNSTGEIGAADLRAAMELVADVVDDIIAAETAAREAAITDEAAARNAQIEAERTATLTLSGKTINLGANTLVATSEQIRAAVTDETGTGGLVFNSSPALAGTPTAPTAAPGTNTTQIATTAFAAAADVAERTATATLTGKTLNLSSNTLVATSAQIAAAVSDETGTGALVFAGSPALTGTPTAPTATAGTDTTQVATTAFVTGAIEDARTAEVDLEGKTIDLAENTLVATSEQIRAAVTDETGTGALVFAGSPALTGTPTVPTAAPGTNTTQAASTAFVTAGTIAERTATTTLTGKTLDLASNTLVATSAQLRAALTDETGSGSAVFNNSPALAGTPTAPTATPGTETTQIATTAFVTGAVATETEARAAEILAERTTTATLEGKTLDLAANTLVATSAQLRAAVTDETGTGGLVFAGSPALTGTPTVPTAAPGTDTTQAASTAFVTAAVQVETEGRAAEILAERTATATLTGKTLNLGSNTLVATSAQIAAAVTDETGTGGLVFNNSPALVGTPTVPTAAPGTNTTQVATTAFVTSAGVAERTATATLTGKTLNLTDNTLVATSAQLRAALTDETGTGALVFAGSPALTGTPTVPTAAPGTDTTQVASTAFVAAADVAERTATATLTGKTLNLGSNTLVATSAQLAAAVSDETGTGALVFAGSPVLTGTPTVPTAAPGTDTTQAASTAFVTAAVEVVSDRVADIEDVLGVEPVAGEDMATAFAIVNEDGVPLLEGDHLGNLWTPKLVIDPQSEDAGPVPIVSVSNLVGTVSTAISANQETGNLTLTREGEFLQDFAVDEWPEPYSYAIADESGEFLLFYINKADGTVGFVPDAPTLALFASQAAGSLSPAGVSEALLPGNVGGGQQYSADLVRFWTDDSGVSRACIGRAVSPGCFIEEGRGALELTLGMGDSTSQGSNGPSSGAIRITAAPAPNTGLMLSTGIRGTGATVFDPDLVTDFAPALDATDGVLGSTGWASYVQFLDAAQATGPRRVSVVHTAGMSGSELSEQLEGGTYFENSIIAAERALELAEEYGRTMICRAVWLRNGANDRSAAVSLADYKTDLVAMQASYTTRLQAVFGGSAEVDLFQSQLAGAANSVSSPGKDAGQIAQAQLEAALENPNIFIACPEYPFPMSSGGSVHGNALKYDLIGEYNAKARIRRNLGATVFCPMVDLAGITVLGSVVTVPFDLVQVPGTDDEWYGLQFTTAFRALRTMQGFSATGTRTVSSVAITNTGATTGIGIVQVTLSGSPGSGDAIEYAYTGATSGVEADYPAAWGNLFDLDPTIGPAGVTLYNPAASFRKVIVP